MSEAALTNNGFMLRQLGPDDLDWLAEVSSEAYPGRIKDWAGFAEGIMMMLRNPQMACLRTENAFLFAGLQRFFYDPGLIVGKTVHFASYGAAPFEIVTLARAGLIWAFDKGAVEFEFDSITGVDFGPLVKWLTGSKFEERRVYQVRSADVRAYH